MSGDNQKKSEKSATTERQQDYTQELPEQSITDRDAQSVKGGMVPNVRQKK